jgi:hypothetical protein
MMRIDDMIGFVLQNDLRVDDDIGDKMTDNIIVVRDDNFKLSGVRDAKKIELDSHGSGVANLRKTCAEFGVNLKSNADDSIGQLFVKDGIRHNEELLK